MNEWHSKRASKAMADACAMQRFVPSPQGEGDLAARWLMHSGLSAAPLVAMPSTPEAMMVSARLTMNFKRPWNCCISISACSSGKSGAVNLTCGTDCTQRGLPSQACAASMMQSSSSTPGTTGLPGKCPARQGCSDGMLMAAYAVGVASVVVIVRTSSAAALPPASGG